MSFENVVLTVIGGVGFNAPSDESFLSDEGSPSYEGSPLQEIQTPYGPVSYSALPFSPSSEIVFISRHQGERHTPPHEINFRALISAAQKIGAPVLAVNSVGLMRAVSLSEDFENGKKTHVTPDSFEDYPFFIPNDFIDFTKNRVCTFYSDETVHVDMTDPYCADIRGLLKTVLSVEQISYSEGIYLCTEGPRFETKAEIRLFSQFADVVGMTGVPEVVLAKEAGLCYASLCVIANPAAGLSQNMVTADEVKIGVENTRKKVFDIISKTAEVLAARAAGNSSNGQTPEKKCECRQAAAKGKL
ncbi:MAG: MTAP family purine nucleoside phosphorylase [Methanimicrococcus sp.]|nr:MTAP family purine nucleoside phosphorylase [Methanimicrococcus sp.]